MAEHYSFRANAMKTTDEIIEEHAKRTPGGLDADKREILRQAIEREDREQANSFWEKHYKHIEPRQ